MEIEINTKDCNLCPVKDHRTARTSLWVASTYFIEGLPRTLLISVGTVFFTDMGVREAYLGFINFFGLPWNLKFLWSPFLDLIGTKRGWMVKIQALLSLIFLFVAILAGLHERSGSPVLIQAIVFLFIAFAFVAATNDIAIDAYYLEGLKSKEEQAAYSGLRTMSYRLAIIFARSVIIAIAGAANWFYGFGVGALTLFIFFIIHSLFLPKFERTSASSRGMTIAEVKAGFIEAFLSYMNQPRFWLVMIFIVTYKLGDEFIFCMKTAFLKRELGVTNVQMSWLAGFIESGATIAGAMLGALWIKRSGLRRAIWPITILMNINLWAYVLLSFLRPDAATHNGITLIAIIHGYENVAAGLGTAALMIFLMRLCKSEHKAAHFAIGSAITTIGSTFLGGFGGVFVEAIGYTNLFIIGFFAALPSMFLLRWVPISKE